MQAKPGKYALKGFTIAEVLVTLALTSLAITFSYATLGYVRQLFYNYKMQNRFIAQYTDFKQRMDYEALKCDVITEESENKFSIKRDTVAASLQIMEKYILLQRQGQLDTFYMCAKNIKKEYEVMKSPAWTNKLVRSLQFETDFTKQKFNFCFYKAYNAAVKLELDKEL